MAATASERQRQCRRRKYRGLRQVKTEVDDATIDRLIAAKYLSPDAADDAKAIARALLRAVSEILSQRDRQGIGGL